MKPISFILAVLLFTACSQGKYAASNRSYKSQVKAFSKIIKSTPVSSGSDSIQIPTQWVGTTNFGMRKPNYVILHHTAQNSCEQTLQTFTLSSTQVSAHYVICKDGTLYHMLNDYLRAWHAGVSKWGNQTDINSCSIGVEIDNNGTDSFSIPQLNTLVDLLINLKKTYNIPSSNFIGHADIAPSRKTDPNVFFPWQSLASRGFGLWYSDTTNVMVPADFNPILALRIIGYDISNITASTIAFRRHFLQTENSGELTEAEKKVLYVLMGKYL